MCVSVAPFPRFRSITHPLLLPHNRSKGLFFTVKQGHLQCHVTLPASLESPTIAWLQFLWSASFRSTVRFLIDVQTSLSRNCCTNYHPTSSVLFETASWNIHSLCTPTSDLAEVISHDSKIPLKKHRISLFWNIPCPTSQTRTSGQWVMHDPWSKETLRLKLQFLGPFSPAVGRDPRLVMLFLNSKLLLQRRDDALQPPVFRWKRTRMALLNSGILNPYTSGLKAELL